MTPKMNACGIVAEYNPFHNGHAYHIQQARLLTHCDVLIAVMSPNFVQRGEPAIINKWIRTQAALDNGVDLVVELPTVYAVQSAAHFAYGSLAILKLAKIESLAFGSESHDVAHLSHYPASFDHAKNQSGFSYAHSASASPLSSNDILAIHYLREIRGSTIKPVVIKRSNDYHSSDLSGPVSSATAIRQAHFSGKNTAIATPLNLDHFTTHQLSDYDALIRYALISASPQHLRSHLLVDEGIENLLSRLAHSDQRLDAIIDGAISRRYTRSRIQRTLISILLNITQDDVQPPQHLRVLGMNRCGQAYLNQLKNDGGSPATSFKHYQFKELEAKATQVYSLVKSIAYQKEQNHRERSHIIIP